MEAPAPPVHADAPPPPTTTTAIPHLPTHTHHHYPTPPPRPPILSLSQPHATLPHGTRGLTTSSPPPPTHHLNPYHHARHPAHPPNPPATHTHHAFPPPPPPPHPPGPPPTTRPHPAHTYAHTHTPARARHPHARSDAYSIWGAGTHADQGRSSVEHEALWTNGCGVGLRNQRLHARVLPGSADFSVIAFELAAGPALAGLCRHAAAFVRVQGAESPLRSSSCDRCGCEGRVPVMRGRVSRSFETGWTRSPSYKLKAAGF